MVRMPSASRRSAARITHGAIGSALSTFLHPRQGTAGTGVAILFRPAPLAQLAEHFHGKEGVYGSSP